MRRWIVVLFTLWIYTMVYAQQLTVRSISVRLQDARAASQPRTDTYGKKCAIVHVAVVGIDDLKFIEAVGSVEHHLNEYVVYVPDGLRSLRYGSKSGSYYGTIVFDDYGLEIESLVSYDVVLETDRQMRSAIFSIHPSNATLIFEGKTMAVDDDGMAIINKPVGKYNYSVMADGYITRSGTIDLTEEKISTVAEIVLEERLFPVSIKVFPENATVFIDNEPYTIQSLLDLKLSEGKHNVRVTAPNFKDEERTINVGSSMPTQYFTLKEAKHDVVKHKEESSETGINIRNSLYLSLGLTGNNADQDYDVNMGGVKFEASPMFHFGRLFAMRTGIGVALVSPTYPNDYEYREIFEDSIAHLCFDAPLQLGISLPFGRYNKHLFSVFGGIYGRASFFIGNSKTYDKYAEKLDNFELGDFYDYGVRGSVRLDLSKFSIGCDCDKSLNGYGFTFCITAGWKIPISKY